MNKTALAIRHVAFEDLGVLAPLLAERGYAVRYLEAGVDALNVDTLTQPDLVVVLGGPIGVYETDIYPFLAAEQEAIAARLRQYKPTLGICLGAQLMARAVGAEVRSTGRAEIGYAPLALTEAGRSSVLGGLGTVPVLHWHGDEFGIPNGATRLAETPGFPNQAFAIGPHILGLQFHLEADDKQIERWLIGHAHELATRGIDPRTIRADAATYGPELASAARGVLASWLAQLG
ncbi:MULTISPECIES: glutamine amidotransferase [unclassified Achromobacter]|uniref:glutamine amidotransferase n=1 Tax=unclassified Achromobacter TaxID=2626865 RepID=UPI000B51AA1F|nr:MULTISPECIES: glutamine amidotransferase [unclassified Achromobacter]OWT80819.1 glutamine amidotransferase [Achromobacter sp. HZ34]OWT81335.1 glutamine amidotransferase [Achromobacter sp. HZ28]